MAKNSFPLINKQLPPQEKTDDEESGNKSFDPFEEREVENPTTDCDTLTHLLKACLGSGILSMPLAFKYSGLYIGFLSTFLVSFICTHCSYVLVKCAHTLYYRCKKTKMNFPEVAEAAFQTGPPWARKYTKFFGGLIKICLFITYFGAVSVYTVIIAENFKQVLDHYTGGEADVRIIMACLLIPLVVLCWIPNLKYLAPFSMVANGFMGISLAITFYYLISRLQPISAVKGVGDIGAFPNFCSITIFAIEAIGVMMPLENNMKNPKNFLGTFGILNKGMFGATVIYAIVGFLGYLAFGDETEGSITLNFPQDEIAAQVTKVFIGLAVLITFGLQFFVCLFIAWDAIKDHFKSNPTITNYSVRTILVLCAVTLAVVVPTIGPFVGLIGAVCFTMLGLIIPVIIEIITYWDEGFGPGNWMIVKNVIIVIVGLIAGVAGARSAIGEIIDVYTK